MIHVRHPLVPVDGRGHRSPQTLLLLDERNYYLREAARLHCAGMSARSAAEFIRTKLSTYRDGRWRRDRAEIMPPPRLAGRIEWLLWCALKSRDAVPAEETLRKLIAAA